MPLLASTTAAATAVTAIVVCGTVHCTRRRLWCITIAVGDATSTPATDLRRVTQRIHDDEATGWCSGGGVARRCDARR